MTITLEPGRLALRNPELGPLLIVTVEHVDKAGMFFDARSSSDTEYQIESWRAIDFLPILQPGDVVLEESEVLDIQYGDVLTEQFPGKIGESDRLRFALLRYGPDTDKESA